MNKTNSLLSKLASLAMVGSIVAAGAAFAQPFKVGDVVEVDDAGINYWERAVIMPFKSEDTQDGNTYRVKRMKFSPLRDPAGEISQTIHIRMATSASAATARTSSSAPPVAATSATAPSPSSSVSGLNPRMNGGLPFIPGTGWDLIGMQKKVRLLRDQSRLRSRFLFASLVAGRSPVTDWRPDKWAPTPLMVVAWL